MPGFYFGEVQNIAEKLEQDVSRLRNQFCLVRYLGWKVLAQRDELGCRDHTIERRANFMAHVSEKLALCPRSFFRPMSRELELMSAFGNQFFQILVCFACFTQRHLAARMSSPCQLNEPNSHDERKAEANQSAAQNDVR